MNADMQMDWLIEVPDNPLYGPTTRGALLEFLRMGEITTSTRIVNCCTGENLTVAEAPFYRQSESTDLAERVEELEAELLAASTTIERLQARIAALEASR
jgi:hypothetical protein